MKALQRMAPVAAAMALLLLVGCSTAPSKAGHSKATPSARSLSRAPMLTPQKAQEVTVYALGLVGTPYRFGGNTPDSGFDCSGLIGHVYKTVSGLSPPRTVARLQGWGQAMEQGQLQTGDLVVFSIGGAVSHAGIYVGEGRFVHAPSSGGRVRMDSLQSSYWKSKGMSVRRP